jgi:hypothetical protein
MGRKNSLLFGLALLVVANIGIGSLDFMSEKSPQTFITIMIFIRLI